MIRLTTLFVVAALLLALTFTSVDAARVVKSVAFRDTKYAHMTMVETLDNGELLMAFQASNIGEGHVDQKIHMVRSYDAGNTFTNASVVVDGHGVPVWGPCLIYNHRQRMLYLYVSISVPQNVREGGRHFPGGYVAVLQSSDRGHTWTAPRKLVPYDDNSGPGERLGNVSKMTANRPIMLSEDEQAWALPCWAEPHPDNKNDTGRQTAFLLVTTDGGQSYAAVDHNSNAHSWLIENWVLPTAPLARSGGEAASVPLQQGFRTQLGWIYTSVAAAGFARGFSGATGTIIPNPDSKTSGAALYQFSKDMARKGAPPASFALAANPDAHGRNKLALFRGELLPSNQTVVWTKTIAVLEDSEQWDSDYPTTIQGRGGVESILVSYTCFSHSAACLATVTDD